MILNGQPHEIIGVMPGPLRTRVDPLIALRAE
jgi:hypothetical protein